ncbi:hypothetical protein EXIGLDRAFT_844832 [Exidia glandulosa HHB12029]|uniref:Uncharacterized protein n=1 Tax=Exidia glandulosa HHB12029 TaxID=1314781 RepID=A0A165BSU6_EXIGL|nr:hypothetical protein EXIGLDRAFT_844832 [Exidia glandulosa HHB12029]
MHSAVSSPMSSSSWMSPAVSGTSIALKIARDATANVPIVGQILGVAVHIADLAKQAQKNKEAMRALARKASILAQRVDEVVSGRTPSANLLERLVNLKGAFTKVEEFMAEQVKKRNPATSVYRSLFVLPTKMEELSQDLDSEVASFSLAAAIDMRLYIEESSLYDGQFRRVRECDIRKLDVIMQRETEHSTVTYVKARVDGVSDLMVVKYVKPRTENDGGYKWHDATREQVLSVTSDFDISHPNLPQLYGRAVENGVVRFTVFRSGVYPVSQFRTSNWDDPAIRYGEFHRIRQYVLAASGYLERQGLGWDPDSFDSIVVDDRGMPSIGTFDDVVPRKGADLARSCHVLDVLNKYDRSLFPAPATAAEFGRVDYCHWGRLKMWFAAIDNRPRVLDSIWARLRDEDLVIDHCKYDRPAIVDFGYIPATVRSQAADHIEDIGTRILPLITLPGGLEVERPTPYINPSNVRGEGSDWVDGYVSCWLSRGTCTQSGVEFPYGLRLAIDYVHRTTPVRIYEDYVLHFSEAVALDLLSILEVPGDVGPQYACTIFRGSVSEAQPKPVWSTVTSSTAEPLGRWTISDRDAEEWWETS